MKAAWEMIILLLCVNLGAWYVNERGIQPATGVNVPINPTTAQGWFNGTQTAQGWSGWAGTSFFNIGDVVSGLNFAIRLFAFAVAGFPYFLYNMGASPAIVAVLFTVYLAVYSIAVVEFISGRTMKE